VVLNNKMKVIVTGGRNYGQTEDEIIALFNALESLSPTIIIQGGASGADSLAKAWGIAAGLEVITVAADWKTYGKSAGPIRNRKMLTEHTEAIVLATPGGKGTENCIQTARQLNMSIILLKDIL
jgi:predicted Rossmann fold nucleotide-binding protein DprA/Smf involved in DNA uptake